jgi:hypothetical protein
MAGKERSPNFPRHDLEDAIKKARTLYEKEGRNAAPRDVVLKHWGYSAKSSSGMVALGAVRAFGLLEGRGDSLKLSSLALDIITDERPASAAREAAIKRAAMLPKVHKDVWDQFDGSLPSDENLKFYLVRERGFTDAGAKDFIAQLRATLAFAQKQSGGSLSSEESEKGKENHRITEGDWVQWSSQGVDMFREGAKLVTAINDEGFAFVEGEKTGLPVGDLRVVDPPKPPTDPDSPPSRLPRRQPGMNESTYPFDGGLATIQWPAQMTKDELTEFETWIDLIKKKAKRATEVSPNPDPDTPQAA